MYYDATGADYISTPSFAIPNTGILTTEMWMKSKASAPDNQAIISNGGYAIDEGFIRMHREGNGNSLYYYYANGTTQAYGIGYNLFQNLDDQFIHIVTVCDYTNKTFKAYRNGVLFGASDL